MSLLDREEYIEQVYFFRVYRERIEENVPAQSVLDAIREEILATTKLPLALDFLKGELLHKGRISDGMALLPHYFTPFQTFVMAAAEADKSRFDMKIALQVLERQAEYLSGTPTRSGLFIYQFECIARNRLGYDRGMRAIADDPFYDAQWKEWIRGTLRQLGAVDFADVIYNRSEQAIDEYRRRTGNPQYEPPFPIFFGAQEGRIARANRGKDPLYMFAALQRQLGYPAVPRSRPKPVGPVIHPMLEQRLQKIEVRLKLLEGEVKGDVDLSEFLAKPPQFDDDAELK